ncbi:hypothetical protein [Streptomyces sp. NPDC096012]|uniref:hypothetical protein n=1 Tax=Streptomyces sp. NPDC096012 TaxID=3155684 RepID=UPI00336A2562
MSASPAVRGLRASVFAAVCLLLAVAGHGLAVGEMPPLWTGAGGFLAVFGLCWALGGRERSLPGIGAAMLLAQTGLHLAFDAAHRSGAGPARALRATSMLHADGMNVVHVNATDTLRTHATQATHAHLPHVIQAHAAVHPVVTAHATAAHVLAALAASWWLRRGEAALWALIRRAAAFVPGLLAWWRDASLPVPCGRAPRLRARPDAPRRPPLWYTVNRRGPPAPIPYSPRPLDHTSHVRRSTHPCPLHASPCAAPRP